MNPVSHTTTIRGVPMRDLRAGTGPVVVFVHGLAVSGRYFVPAMQALSQRYDCRAPDLPGFGASGDPAVQLDVPGLADALASWLRANDIRTAALVGNSAGCQYIVDCVSRSADITGPIVLIGPATDRSARTAAAQVRRLVASGFTEDIKQLPAVVEGVRSAGLRRVRRTFAALLDDRIEDKLRDVSQPALVIRGSKDPLAPRRWASQVAGLLPAGSLVEIRGGAHVVHATQPRETATAIDTFLSRVVTR